MLATASLSSIFSSFCMHVAQSQQQVVYILQYGQQQPNQPPRKENHYYYNGGGRRLASLELSLTKLAETLKKCAHFVQCVLCCVGSSEYSGTFFSQGPVNCLCQSLHSIYIAFKELRQFRLNRKQTSKPSSIIVLTKLGSCGSESSFSLALFLIRLTSPRFPDIFPPLFLVQFGGKQLHVLASCW